MVDKQALNKKLAERSGFKAVYDDIPVDSSLHWDMVFAPEDGETPALFRVGRLPDFTQSTDATLKWLVPLSLDILIKQDYCPPIMKLFQLWYDELVSLTGDSSNTEQAAFALCLAIEKIIDKESADAIR